jgi:putative NADH-flavin reductase
VRIAVLGASGRTGRHVVAQALGHGHDVIALVRDAARAPERRERLRILVGDVLDPATLVPAIDGADAVVSAIGAPLAREVHLYSDGTANTLRAMGARGVRRLVVVSAAGVGAVAGQGLSITQRLLRAAPGTRAIFDDMERMEGDVILSDLDWTIVRPSGLTDGPFTGVYRVVEAAAVPKGSKVSREDLAALLVKCAETDLYVHRAVAVAY